jgi:hypothetical protein
MWFIKAEFVTTCKLSLKFHRKEPLLKAAVCVEAACVTKALLNATVFVQLLPCLTVTGAASHGPYEQSVFGWSTSRECFSHFSVFRKIKQIIFYDA